MVFLFLFLLQLGLLVVFGQVSGIALYLGELWPLLLIFFVFCALGLAAQAETDRLRRRPIGNYDHRSTAPGAVNMHRIDSADAG